MRTRSCTEAARAGDWGGGIRDYHQLHGRTAVLLPGGRGGEGSQHEQACGEQPVGPRRSVPSVATSAPETRAIPLDEELRVAPVHRKMVSLDVKIRSSPLFFGFIGVRFRFCLRHG